MPVPDNFHPSVASWFESAFKKPTAIQEAAWPTIRKKQHTLIAAPTGSGKTLAAFFSAINELVVQGLKHGLEQKTTVLYISPLKALSNDIERNLQVPLKGINEQLQTDGYRFVVGSLPLGPSQVTFVVGSPASATRGEGEALKTPPAPGS